MVKKGVLWLKNNKSVVLSVIFLIILINTVLIKGNSDFVIFGMLGFYVAAIFSINLRAD